MRSPRPNRRLARGFSMVETLVTSLLSAMLLYIVVHVWLSFDRAASEILARCTMTQEADIAFLHLADDLRGHGSSRPDTRVYLMSANQLHVICEDQTVIYEVEQGSLYRSVSPGDEPSLLVAHHVESLAFTPLDLDGNQFVVTLTMTVPFPDPQGGISLLSRPFSMILVLA